MTRAATRQERDGAGLIALLIGLGITALGGGVFPDLLHGAHAPMWVLLAAGGVFALAGISLLTQGRTPDWVQRLILNCLLTLFAAIPAWIAWGGSRHGFSASAGWVQLHFGFEFADIGRMVFAASALLMGLIASLAWISWFAKLSWTARGGLGAVAVLAANLLLVVLPAEPRWPEVRDDHERLGRYALMVEDEGWSRIEGHEPRRWNFPPWRNFEQWTKAARSRLAAGRVAPAGQEIVTIPALVAPPAIDGAIGEGEWRGARRIPLEPESLGSSVLIASDDRFLYLAADAPADTTATGFDQFRFWFHIRLSPWLDNERVFVDRSGAVTALRATRFPWGDYPPRSRTDWRIYENARGASSLDGHRRFELALDLAEAGITPGVHFPAWLEIEGDPLRDAAGKFKARSDLGRAGSHTAPLWLRVAAP